MRINGGMKASEQLGEEDQTAAGLVAQAKSLAARRGHAQVTPLHIASAILSASPALLLPGRPQCSRHYYSIDALGLCLGAALDRLAVASTTSAHHVPPAPSNAFLAALKRAQRKKKPQGARERRRSWGRRGSAVAGESEVERLVASVLVDPSVGRVVRDAAAASSRQADPPNPAVKEIRVGARQPSLGNAYWELQPIPNGSDSQGSQAKSGTEGRAIFATEVVARPTTVTLPPWLRRYHDTLRSRSTHRGSTNNDLQHLMQAARRRPKFSELTAQNLKILCGELELRVPWHGSIVPGISSVVLRCRSGMTTRARKKPISSLSSRTATWLLFQGSDDVDGYLVARELARLVFGSYSEFTALQGNSDIIIPTRSGNQLAAIKRQRSLGNNGGGGGGGYLGERLFEVIRENPHRVILINGVDRLDRDSETHVKNAVKEGTMRGCNGEVISLEDAIVVLMSSKVVDSGCVVSSPRVKRPRIGRQSREEGDVMEREVRSCRFTFDLNTTAEDGKEEEDDLADEEEAGIADIVDGVFFFN